MKGIQAMGRAPADRLPTDRFLTGLIPASIPPNMAYYLIGETYKYRDMIKRNDGWWDKINRKWWISADGWEKFLAEWDAMNLAYDLKEERSEYLG